MTPTRRALLASVLATPAVPAAALATIAVPATLATIAVPAIAQDWPTRPIRVVVPNAAGGAADTSIRLISDRLTQLLGQPVVVDNRGGGGGTIAGAAVAQSAPDGTTFLVDNFANVVNPLVLTGLSFDYRTSFVPVTQIMSMPMGVVVRADLPWRTLAELIAVAKARPGTISMGQPGNGTAAHLTLVLLQQRAGIEFNQVPYRSGGEVTRDLLSGTLETASAALSSALPLVRDGKIRMLAVTSRARSSVLPDAPTLEESGLRDAVIEEWFGLSAPRGTPPAIVARMAQAVAAALQAPEIRARYAQLGAEPVGSTPEAYAATVEATRAGIERIVREGNVQLN
ncbi:Bug family tripartite tricarboxylate transporter substrate binding protein [Falsiroseomonas sp. HW251]|uniref:Bug family tripartite tricarboxylate transporter substrate binding protein n=1 Tax=Falsiroseomonas sp. HW251 TaxID=3390998 RepID=UPI003D31E869